MFLSTGKPLVAVVHLAPSLGYAECPGVERALRDLGTDLEALAGVDAILLENDNDKPHTLTVDKAAVAWLTRMCVEARRLTALPLGIGVQRIDWQATFAVAAAASLDFVRLDVFVDEVIMMNERVAVAPAEVRAYRQAVMAQRVALWTDVHVKHAELVDGSSLEDSADRAVKEGSDAVLITGTRTGEPPEVQDLQTARAAVADRVPVYIGSGLRPDLARALWPYADGALCGTALKVGDRIDRQRVTAMVEAWADASQQ